MTFYQARTISQAGLHVRRAAWSVDKWFMVWRGTWFCYASGAPPRPVQTTDYSADELLATDWTSVPAALAACAIDPTIGSTGGGSAMPGVGGFPLDLSSPGGAGGDAGGSGSPDAPPALPTPTPGTGISVTFAGLTLNAAAMTATTGVDLNQQFSLTGSGNSYSKMSFVNGQSVIGPFDLLWTITATRSGFLWDVELGSIGGPTGGFVTPTVGGKKIAGSAIANSITGIGSNVYGGTATVGTG